MIQDTDERLFIKKATMLYEMGNVLMELRDRGEAQPVLLEQTKAVLKLIGGLEADLEQAGVAMVGVKAGAEEHPVLQAIEDVKELCYDLLMEVDG